MEGREWGTEQLDATQRHQLCSLLTEFEDVFQAKPGKTTLAEHRIEVGNEAGVRQPPYRLPQAYKDSVRQEIQEMLEHGIIEPTSSDWALPMVVVRKKDHTIRICVDYRKLNAKSRMDAYPVPRVDDMIDQVGNVCFISTLDLTKGYWQVPSERGGQREDCLHHSHGAFSFAECPLASRERQPHFRGWWTNC